MSCCNCANAGDVVEGIIDNVKDAVDIDVGGIKQAGKDCYIAAKETSTICTTTVSKAISLVAFGVEMKTVLNGFRDGITAKDFVSLRNILGGDKMKPAVKLAREMDDLALACTEQSLKMIDTIDKGIETLPDVLEDNVESRIEKSKEDGGKDEDPELPDIKDNVRALETLAMGVSNSNPVDAVKAFSNAFDGISGKGKLCKTMFFHMRDFAEDVAGVADAIEKFNIGEMVGHIHDLLKDLWRCLRLSDLIRSFANAVAKVIKSIMKVINSIIEKVQGVDIDDFISANYGGCCAPIERNFNVNFTRILNGGALLAVCTACAFFV